MYNTEPVSLDQAFSIAQTYLECGLIPLLVGPPGCGKTTLAHMLASAAGAELISLRLNTIPPEEAIGLQFVDAQNGATVRYPPAWVPASDGSDGAKLVFFDEFMQAPDEYRKGVMSALLEGYIGTHQLPRNCMFIAAGNSAEDGSNVYELDSATADRFGIILVRSEFESWANNFAGSHEIHLAIMSFLRLRTDHFDGRTTDDEADTTGVDEIIKTSSRKWTQASDYLKAAEAKGDDPAIIRAGLNGLIGSRINESFWQVYGQLVGAPTLEEMVAMDTKGRQAASPQTLDMLWAYGQAMIWGAKSARNIGDYLELFRDWQVPVGVPVAEARSNIVETMLGRARHIYKVNPADDPRIARLVREGQQSTANDDVAAPLSLKSAA